MIIFVEHQSSNGSTSSKQPTYGWCQQRIYVIKHIFELYPSLVLKSYTRSNLINQWSTETNWTMGERCWIHCPAINPGDYRWSRSRVIIFVNAKVHLCKFSLFAKKWNCNVVIQFLVKLIKKLLNKNISIILSV